MVLQVLALAVVQAAVVELQAQPHCHAAHQNEQHTHHDRNLTLTDPLSTFVNAGIESLRTHPLLAMRLMTRLTYQYSFCNGFVCAMVGKGAPPCFDGVMDGDGVFSIRLR